MALSPEQKAANKEASLLRQAAYRARRKELDVAKDAIDVSALAEEADQANAHEEALRKARNEKKDAIYSQIAILQEQIKSLDNDPMLESAVIARRNAYKVLHQERERQEHKIEALFPDLSRGQLLGYEAWEPPAGYIERYAAEHTEEIAKKKAKRKKV